MSRQEDVEELKSLLMERKRRLWGELTEGMQSRADDLLTQRDNPQDNGEASMVDELADEGLRYAEIRREELTRIDEAERKLEDGTYGICQECGEPIGIARLRVMPYATECVRCQSEHEEKPPASKF